MVLTDRAKLRKKVAEFLRRFANHVKNKFAVFFLLFRATTIYFLFHALSIFSRSCSRGNPTRSRKHCGRKGMSSTVTGNSSKPCWSTTKVCASLSRRATMLGTPTPTDRRFISKRDCTKNAWITLSWRSHIAIQKKISRFSRDVRESAGGRKKDRRIFGAFSSSPTSPTKSFRSSRTAWKWRRATNMDDMSSPIDPSKSATLS